MSRMRTRTATPRGRGCALYADCRYSLVEPSDLDRVFCILYEGQPRVCRVAGELVNLSRACALSCLMLGSPYPPGALEALAACARYLCGPAFTSDLAARARAAGELGPHVSGPHSGHRLHPAFGIRRPALRSRPADGFPVYGKTIALIYMCAFPDREYVSAYSATGLHPQRTTSLRGYTPTGLHAAARPNGGRVAHGRPRTMLLFLREVPSGPPESRLHLQAFLRNCAARLKIHA